MFFRIPAAAELRLVFCHRRQTASPSPLCRLTAPRGYPEYSSSIGTSALLGANPEHELRGLAKIGIRSKTRQIHLLIGQYTLAKFSFPFMAENFASSNF